ncbi:DinB family protein [Mucilaginibacter sp. SP1R1]|uniref:DinB family protein n=1 Tax=Mucilaginibacter sp. SP1R1 TaxID=2723091 RepID=UPI001622998D|nr:DinB family protein [Mucilaginibacter sp. SP1R1]MBB6148962.1 putative damage-inducible protein DinB [Mucilaginibacter sp. SP1R1]
MSNTTIQTNPQPAIDIFIKIAVSNWDLQNTRLNNLLDKLTDDQLIASTAPGRNSGVYLLGHLTAVSDGMFTFLELGDRLYPQLDQIFVKNPENSGLEKPSIIELKGYWNEVNNLLKQKMKTMQPTDWFTKHSAISADDFAKEPHRNKLNILINRTNHQSYHLGQLVYLLNKAAV